MHTDFDACSRILSELGVRRFPVLRADERELREFAPEKIERALAKKTQDRENP